MKKDNAKLYVDTSVLTAYYCPESLSDTIESVLSRRSKLAISWLVDVEFASAISKKVRMKELQELDGAKIISQFLAHREQNIFELVSIDYRHYRLARDWLAQFKTPLRTLDALHLAIAQLESCELITADTQQAETGIKMGLKVIHVK